MVGIPDELYGEVPAAMIKTKGGEALNEDQIRTYLRSRMAKYKVPVKFAFVEEIPLSSGGKPCRKSIRKLLSSK